MLTLDQIKPEAERLFGAPLDLAIGDLDGCTVLIASTPTNSHGVDVSLDDADLGLTLEQFSARLLEPAMAVLHRNVHGPVSDADIEAQIAAARAEDAA